MPRSIVLGRVVRKPVNANPGLKINRGNNFSRITVLSVAYVLCSLRLLMLKTEGFFKTILKNSKMQTTFRRYTTPLSSQNDKS